MLAVRISVFLAYTTFPETSIETEGSSRPSCYRDPVSSVSRETDRPAYLDNDRTFIVTDSNLVAVLSVGNTPTPLQTITQGRLESIRRRVPDLDSPVLGTGNDDGQRRVEDREGYVGGMPFERLHARLVLVVPDLDGTVVTRGDHVRPVTAVVVLDIVDALFVRLQAVVGDR